MSDAWRYAVWPNPRSRSRALKCRKFGHFQRLSPLSFIMGAGKWPRILKLGHNTYSLLGPDFLILSQFLCHVTLKLAVSRSRPSWYGATLFKFLNTVSSRCHFYVTSYYTNVPMLRFTTQEMVNFFVCLSVCWLLCWTVWCSLPQLFCNCQTISK